MKKFLLLSLLLIVIGVSYGGIRWWQSPATSSNVDHGSTNASNVLADKTSLQPWQTAYFSTLIPTYLQVRSSKENSLHGISGTYLLTSVSPRINDQVGVTLASLGTNSLDEVSGVKLRLNNPAAYTQVTRSFAPPGSYLFQGAGDYEMALFWQHNGTYSAVVVSGSSARSGELDAALASIVGNWQWQ